MKTVLVVDDEVDLADMLGALIAAEGYRTVLAYDGVDAFRKCVEEKPDLVLTDLMMPRMDGNDLIEQIRATPSIANTPVLLMSSTPVQGHSPFFRKPFDLEPLVAEIRKRIG